MTIASVDDYLAAQRQVIEYSRAVSRTTTAGIMVDLSDLAGQPGAATLPGSSQTGVVPTDATPGYPAITNFAGGADGYISRLMMANTVAGRLTLFDKLWIGGTYDFASGTTVVAANGDPSPLTRVPDNDWSVVEIYFQIAVATSGTQTVSVQYTDQDGVSRASGQVVVSGSTLLGRLVRIPLFAGGRGVQKIESVTVTNGSAGSWNVVLMRRLADARNNSSGSGDMQDLFKTGLPRVYQDSALTLVGIADSTATGQPDVKIEVASK